MNVYEVAYVCIISLSKVLNHHLKCLHHLHHAMNKHMVFSFILMDWKIESEKLN